MVSAIISRVVILIFGTLYPAYASYKAVRTKNVKEYVKWMMYWIVFALFCCIETFSDVFISWLPFYYELKIVFVIWMLSPLTQGSSFIFKKFVHPQLARREKEIDEMIAQASKQGYSTLLSLGSKGVNYASQMVMRTAIMGQSKLVDHLRRSYSTSDLTDDGHSVMQRHEAVGGGDDGEDELDNRLIEDNAELQMRSSSSKSKLSRSKSTASSYSLSSVKEEEDNEGDEEEKVITETFTIPVSSRKPLTAKEDFLLRAQRLARCQSLPPPITDIKPSFPSPTVQNTLDSKRHFFANASRSSAKSLDEDFDSRVIRKKKTIPGFSGLIGSSVLEKREIFAKANSQDNVVIQRSKPQVIAGINSQARKRLLQRAQSEEPMSADVRGRMGNPKSLTETQDAVSIPDILHLGKERDIENDTNKLLCEKKMVDDSADTVALKGEAKDNEHIFLKSSTSADKIKALNELMLLSDEDEWMSIEDDEDINQDSLIFCEIDSVDSDDSPIVEYKSFVPHSPDKEWNRKDSSDIIIIDSPKLIRLQNQLSGDDIDIDFDHDHISDRERIPQNVEKPMSPSFKRLLSGKDVSQEPVCPKVDDPERSLYKSSSRKSHHPQGPNQRPFQFKGSKFPKLDDCQSQSAPTSPASNRTKKHSRKAYYTLDPSLGSWRMELSSRRLYASTPDTRPDLFRLAQSSSSPLAQEMRNLPHGSSPSPNPMKDKVILSRSSSTESSGESDHDQFVPSHVLRPRARSLSFEREHGLACNVRRLSQDLRSSSLAPTKKT